GCSARFHVVCAMPPSTVRTLPSAMPMFMALCPVCARQASQHVVPAGHDAATTGTGLIWNISVFGSPFVAVIVCPLMPLNSPVLDVIVTELTPGLMPKLW